MRHTLLVLILLGLALDKPGDAEGRWQSPMAPLGRLLMENLNRTIPLPVLRISLLALLLGCLLLIWMWRRSSQRRSEEPGHVRAASPMEWSLLISLMTTLALCPYGWVRGGDLQMINLQIQPFVLLLTMAYLLMVSLRGTLDYRALWRVILVAACVKAMMAIWVRLTIEPELFATTHGDSMLFACSVAILLASLFGRPAGGSAWWLMAMLAVLLGGMIANNRRIAWVEVAAVVLVFYALSPWTARKRRLTRAALLSLPLVLAYGAVGWNSPSRLSAPVQLVRSLVDADINSSTSDRDVENSNLVYTMREHLLIGTGFGHPYAEVRTGHDISAGFKEFRFLPHNSVLLLWSSGGIVGFTGMWVVLVVGMYMATRSYFHTRSADERIAAFAAIASLIVYVIQCWGDIGFAEKEGIFLVGAALAVAGQLATSTGAWIES